MISTVAGNGSSDYSGDNGLAKAAGLSPSSVAVNDSGQIFIADGYNHRIRKISKDGIISTYAGAGTNPWDGATIGLSQLAYPSSLRFDKYGNLYFTEAYTHRIRKININRVNTWTGNVSTAWENPDNWSLGILPDPITIVAINSGTVVLSSNVSIKSLQLAQDVNFKVNSGYTLTINH
jgi:hypothetical protein